uniref:DUF4550 domain-containing protein n=1 Tax=Angiostrongylus cantonensis TaxID=6313 RepID=A0A0K0DE58_ANGCA
MFREHIAEATKCTFLLKVRDRQTEEELLEPEPYTAVLSPNERTQGFKVPHSSGIGTTLIQVYHTSTYAGRICEITTTLFISPSQFRITEWDQLAQPTPLHTDWRFRLLDDKSTIVKRQSPVTREPQNTLKESLVRLLIWVNIPANAALFANWYRTVLPGKSSPRATSILVQYIFISVDIRKSENVPLSSIDFELITNKTSPINQAAIAGFRLSEERREKNEQFLGYKVLKKLEIPELIFLKKNQPLISPWCNINLQAFVVEKALKMDRNFRDDPFCRLRALGYHI